MEPPRRIVVPRTDAGNRLDRFLAERLGLSRGYVQRLLARERVRLDGHAAAKGATLRAGDAIEILEFRHPREGPRANPALDLPVLAQGGGLLAVDKPAGLPTHPLDFEETHTALNGVLARHPELAGIGEGGVRSGVVHRLDTGTSGVLVFATDPEAWSRARASFRERRVEKRYVARVHGRLARPLECALRLEPRGDHMRVVADGGVAAETRFAPLAAGADTSLVEAFPATGAMHQIRASLAHLGHPIVGDGLYGSPVVLGRHLLHACRIRIREFEASSPLPDAFGAEG